MCIVGSIVGAGENDMQQFTDAKARKLSAPGLHTVDTTLYLRITDRSKYWVQRITIKGKRHDLGLGAFPVVSVDEAREAAFLNRRLVRAGGDPLAEKRKALKPTFEAAAMASLDTLRPTWRNGKTEQDWRRYMNTYVLPRIGHKRIDLIDRADILDILVPMWTKKNATARRLRGWIKAVFSWAQAFGHIEINPAADAISAALPRGAGNIVNRKLKCPLFRILKCPLVDKEIAVSIILCISPYLATVSVSLQAHVPTTLPCASPSAGNSPP